MTTLAHASFLREPSLEEPRPGLAGLPLRHAQRVLAALIEGEGWKRDSTGKTFCMARRRTAVRKALAVLAADDSARLARWLALQLATRAPGAGFDDSRNPLSRIDAAMASAVQGMLARVREELALQGGSAAA